MASFSEFPSKSYRMRPQVIGILIEFTAAFIQGLKVVKVYSLSPQVK